VLDVNVDDLPAFWCYVLQHGWFGGEAFARVPLESAEGADFGMTRQTLTAFCCKPHWDLRGEILSVRNVTLGRPAVTALVLAEDHRREPPPADHLRERWLAVRRVAIKYDLEHRPYRSWSLEEVLFDDQLPKIAYCRSGL
jgi:hypothetical protein